MTEKSDVIKLVTRLIDFGVGAVDDELDTMTLEQIADKVINTVQNITKE